MSPPLTVVVGGGISGLVAARALVGRGLPVTLLEGAARCGGTLATTAVGGFLLEAGPNGVLDREGRIRRLASDLGIGDRFRPAAAAADVREVFLEGRVRRLPASPPALLRSDVLPLRAKLRLLLEPFSRRGPAGEDESLAAFGRRHFGKTVTRTLLDAFQTGIFAGDIERLSVGAAFPRLAALEQTHRSLLLAALRVRRPGREAPARIASFEGGMQSLVDALVAALGEHVRTGSKVLSLRAESGGWRVRTDAFELRADGLVLAVGASAAAQLLESLSPRAAALLAAMRAVDVAVVHLGWNQPLHRAPEGFGMLVPATERRDVLGVIYASSAFPFRAPGGGTLLTAMVGGAHRPELAALPEEMLVERVRAELAALFGIRRPPELARVVRWPAGIPQYELGHRARLAEVREALSPLPPVHLLGSAYDGVGVAECVRSAEEFVSSYTFPAATDAAARSPGRR